LINKSVWSFREDERVGLNHSFYLFWSSYWKESEDNIYLVLFITMWKHAAFTTEHWQTFACVEMLFHDWPQSSSSSLVFFSLIPFKIIIQMYLSQPVESWRGLTPCWTWYWTAPSSTCGVCSRN
jgi:hypothetical protein